MSLAAREFAKGGAKILSDSDSDRSAGDDARHGDLDPSARFLTEVDAGRWHKGLQEFELKGPLVEVVRQLLQVEDQLLFCEFCMPPQPGTGRDPWTRFRPPSRPLAAAVRDPAIHPAPQTLLHCTAVVETWSWTMWLLRLMVWLRSAFYAVGAAVRGCWLCCGVLCLPGRPGPLLHEGVRLRTAHGLPVPSAW